jgi:phage terminase Nu1 subunit (DNA packaging protein)|tara:strand:- start:3881 stop:4360 length:480 start_codon:yes stop_codon:yes gene_type:complete
MATIKEVAEHLDLTTKRMHELFNENILIKTGKSGGQDVDDCRVRYIRYLRSLSKGRNTSSGDLNDERTRLTKAQADKAELELQEKENELISTDLIKTIWSDYVSNVRSKLLALPSKLGHLTQAAETYAEAEAIIKESIYECLEELSDDATTKANLETTE